VVVTLRQRLAALVLAVFVGGVATLFGGVQPAAAAPPDPVPGQSCTTDEWRNPSNFDRCVKQLKDIGLDRVTCVEPPPPEAPDSGMAGWFASRTAAYDLSGPKGLYTRYGYAGFDYTTYDINCVKTTMHPDFKFENTVANGEFLIASAVIGASNALRERAWDPKAMWGWADPLVDKATKAVYQRVFTIFGAVTLAVVGLYLLWRSRQSDMSIAMTTAGWAVLVMILVTAIARWPVWSANAADSMLIGSLNAIHQAVGPPTKDVPPDQCVFGPDACKDHRQPAARSSDTVVDGMLYRNWLRGELGSADSPVAQKYGPALYDAKSFTWGEIADIRKDSNQRQLVIDEKNKRWEKIAEKIKTEDPEAYEYLQGTKGMDRIGAGFIAILSSLFFAMFDITASLLILLGFVIFRWAVVAAPILGTVGLLKPASGGLRRLVNAVVAAMFNIVIFGAGAAIYLFAVDLIMSTALPGWLQVALIWLTGVVGWLLLRPYRRITQLGGKDSAHTLTSVGNWHRLFFRDVRQAATLQVVEAGVAEVRGRRQETAARETRPETRTEQPTVTATTTSPPSRPEEGRAAEPARTAARRPARTQEWTESDVPDGPPSYTIYRPDSGDVRVPNRPVRHRPESVSRPR
jgi:hypothetical protein